MPEKEPLFVTKSYLPTQKEYGQMLARIWEKTILTNDGPLNKELEKKLAKFLKLKPEQDFIRVTSNGTVVLQMALKAIGVKPGDKIITTPFSYVATTNAILWENCIPLFADIKPDDFNIDPAKIKELLNEHPDTKAILATHVYGNACEVEQIQRIVKQHQAKHNHVVKVIYDAAHTFGATYKRKHLLRYGDFSTCSFHATKVFHTVEGGCIISHDAHMDDELSYMRSFGHRGDHYHSVGINAKNSEFHTAMGLVMLPKVQGLIAQRKQVAAWYDARLNFSRIHRPTLLPGMEYNYAYYPVVFESEDVRKRVQEALEADQITPRRYFYPSLNTLAFLDKSLQCSCPESEKITATVLSLPFYPELSEANVERVCRIVNENC
jgi:dTDP-4-amino-4,6-dideoxygalactose transaminase